MAQFVVPIAGSRIAHLDEDSLVTYSLGSCLGVSVWCAATRQGGLVHCLLPLARINPDKARERPAMFVSSGVPAMIKELLARGAKREYLVIKAAGGASLLGDDRAFQTGARNIAALKALLHKNNLTLAGHQLGGATPRTMSLDIGSGRTRIKTPGEVMDL